MQHLAVNNTCFVLTEALTCPIFHSGKFTDMWLTRTTLNFTGYPASLTAGLKDRNIPGQKLYQTLILRQEFQFHLSGKTNGADLRSWLPPIFRSRDYEPPPPPCRSLARASPHCSHVRWPPCGFHVRAAAASSSSERILMGTVYPLAKRAGYVFIWQHPGCINFNGDSLWSVYQPTGKPKCSLHTAATTAHRYWHFVGTPPVNH